MSSPNCPGCGGVSCRPIENGGGRFRCVTCSRVFTPAPTPPGALPVAPPPADLDPGDALRMVENALDAGLIARDGRAYVLDGVRLGTSKRAAAEALAADVTMLDTLKAVIDAGDAGE